MPDALLNAQGLEQTFGSGASEVRAVRGIDLELAAGERLLVMGPSGSGKTTLVSMIGGLLTPTHGRVLLADLDVYGLGERERARLRLQRLGFIFQSFNLLSALTAEENVAVPMTMAGARTGQARTRARQLLEDLGLARRQAHRPRDLSGGEKQRVAIARALVNRPDVVIADEPTANLDSETGRQVAEVLCGLGCEHGKGVIIVSHDQRLLDIASRVVWIEDGKIHEPSPDAGDADERA